MSDPLKPEDVTTIAQTMLDTSVVLERVSHSLSSTSELTKRVQRTSTLNALLAALTIIVVLLMSIFIIEVRRDISTNQRVIDTIQQCTTPGYECYDHNLARSNERLAPIVAKVCAAIPENHPEKHTPPCSPTGAR